MKKICIALSILLLVGCSATKSETRDKSFMIKTKDLDPNSGADSYASAGDNSKSRYYVNLDFYNMKSDDQLTIIEHFKTLQQTTEWSCGPATMAMVLYNFGLKSYTEEKLATMMHSHTDKDDPNATIGSANNFGEYGTNVEQIVTAFQTIPGIEVVETSYKGEILNEDVTLTDTSDYPASKQGNVAPTFSAMSLYTSENSDTSDKFVDAKDSYFVKWIVGNLKANRPIMVEWADWDGHWQAIIGYDNNGTEGIGDDILIFADPYDTSDHMQDGYYYYPLERWFYMWSDESIAPKPYQLQQYVVVDYTKVK